MIVKINDYDQVEKINAQISLNGGVVVSISDFERSKDLFKKLEKDRVETIVLMRDDGSIICTVSGIDENEVRVVMDFGAKTSETVLRIDLQGEVEWA